MTTASDGLDARLRAIVPGDSRVEQKKMFGGLGYLINGNMFAAATGKGLLMVRLGKSLEADARALPGAAHVDFRADHRAGFLTLPAAATADDAALRAWYAFGLAFAETLPPK